ncbi:hypothetical protein [Bremerella sp.]|uniref:hypothetical protein n=1 Tax=Bremerella sp. TaxID=2795602 RepID=UPI00391A121D
MFRILNVQFGTPRDISVLESKQANYEINDRTRFPIAVIDDEDFAYHDLLRRHDFQLTHFEDITDVRQLFDYPIVLCDVKGVGKHFESRFEGAHLMSEIKKRYPAKLIYGYTGNRFDASFNRYFSLCESVEPKDRELEDWIELLDTAITHANNPVFQWIKLRANLLVRRVPLYQITLLEDNYVTSIISNSKEFPSSSITRGLSSDIRQLITDFAATVVAKLLTS